MSWWIWAFTSFAGGIAFTIGVIIVGTRVIMGSARLQQKIMSRVVQSMMRGSVPNAGNGKGASARTELGTPLLAVLPHCR